MKFESRRSFYSISLIALALFWFAALLSASGMDWPFAKGASFVEVGNYAGPVGSALAWISIKGIGLGLAWLLPFLVLCVGIDLFKSQRHRISIRLLKVFGFLILLTTFFSLIPYTERSAWLSGWLGGELAAVLSAALGRIGASIVLLACILILLGRVGIVTRSAARSLGNLRSARSHLSSLLGAVNRGMGRVLSMMQGLFDSLMTRMAARKRHESIPIERNRPGRRTSTQAKRARAVERPPAGFKNRSKEQIVETTYAVKNHSADAKPGVVSSQAEIKTGERIPLDRASLPPLSLLEGGGIQATTFSQDKLREWARILEEKLANYNIHGRVTAINHGPLVTTFEFEPSPGVKVKEIVSRTDDITLAMKARSLRLIAPIPGRSVVGIEVPNPIGSTVHMKSILEEIPEKARLSGVMTVIGVDVMGKPFYMNLCEAPHLLIAGTTGSGKSVCLHCIVASILFQYRPGDVRLLVIDPKMVEMNVYNGIPHLLHPVTNDPRETVRVFQYLIAEMERRKELFRKAGVKNIESYNSKLALDEDEGDEKLPYIVLIVDELGDLVLSKGPDLESLLSKLSNMARAVGIHMVLATQRPSVDVIVGKTKANFPTRIAFRVASKVDSRTILDATGAEKLLGRGDMLYMDSKHIDPLRLHGALITENEVERLVAHWKSYEFEKSFLEMPEHAFSISGGSDERDPLYEEGRSIVIHYRQGSTSLLQRKLHIGYARAARLLDQLEENGVVGPPDGSRPREVFVPEEVDGILPEDGA